jgi:hypothetical protein
MEDQKRLWKKVGGGSFRLGKRIIKPNEKFYAEEHEIPKAFRDVIIPLDGEPTPKIDIKKVKEQKHKYKMEETNRKGYVHIVDNNGKQISEKPIKEEEAEKLITDLEE